jgi:hypothetical protein
LHQIVGKNANFDDSERKVKREHLQTEWSGNREEQVFSNLNSAETRTVRTGLVK